MARRASSIPRSKWAHLPPARVIPSNLYELAGRLNAYNLTDLLTLSALLSVADEPLVAKVPAARTLLNFSLRRLFLLSVLQSKAAEYKQKLVTPQTVQMYWNALAEIEDPDFDEGRDTLYSMLLPILSNQLRFQNLTVAARAQQVYALLIAGQPQGPAYLDLDATFTQHYGLSLLELLQFLINLETWIISTQKVTDQLMRLPSDASASVVWLVLVDNARRWRLNQLPLTAARLSEGLEIERRVVDAALACLSAPIPILREWQAQHQGLALKGLPGTAPFVLERYPLVQLSSGQLVLPERTALPVTVSQTVLVLLDAAIPAAKRPAYDKTRGQMLETYLLGLLRDAFPAPALVVHERKYYRSPDQRIQGPDVLLLDPRDPRPVLIEAKATRSRVETASGPTASLLHRNYGEAFKALGPDKAARKIEDLRRGLTEYRDIQAEINQATERPLVIALVQEMPPRAGRLLGRHLRRFPDDPLRGASYDILLMDLIELEMAVHHAKTVSVSLRTVLDVEVRGVAYELDPDAAEFLLHSDLPEADPNVELYCMRHPEVFG